MRRLGLNLVLAASLLVAACATTHIYFPAAQAERAADRIISDVWGTVPARPEEQPRGNLRLPAWGAEALIDIRDRNALYRAIAAATQLQGQPQSRA